MGVELPPLRPLQRRARGGAPGGVTRDRRLNLALSADELELVRAVARDMAPGAWVAQAALAVARGEVHPLPASDREAIRALMEARVSLSRIGNNLNQVTAAANRAVAAGERLDGAISVEQVAAVLARLDAALRLVDEATVAVMGR
jgi:hypothetical protein